MAKWTELAKEILGSEDEIQRSYTVNLNDKSGYLIMSNKKLLFLEEKGFIRVKYSKALELPYDHISKVNVTPKFMVIIDNNKKEYNFTDTGVDLKKIMKELQNLIATSKW